MPYHPMQSAPLTAKQLTNQERLRTDEEISQYGEPLDTFFHTHGTLSDECDEGFVHIFRDPQDLKFNGTSFHKKESMYYAKISLNNVMISLGRFALKSNAAKTYDNFAILLNQKISEEKRSSRYSLNFLNEHEYISARIKEIKRNRKK